MKAVIDTNLLIRYALTQGQTLTNLFAHWQKETFIYLSSHQIIAEMKDVLQRPRLRVRMTADVEALIALVETQTLKTPSILDLEGACRDPKDIMFIVCAVEGKADYIVSDDKNLLELVRYQGVAIIRPESFVAILDT